MPINIATASDYIVLDACCIINLCASGRMADILSSLPKPAAVSAFVHDEEIKRCDLQPVVAQGLLTVISVLSVDEEATFVNFAFDLDDGEAVTAAIALHRHWVLATDERKANTILTQRYPQLQRISTPHLIEHWVATTNPPADEVRIALQKSGQMPVIRLPSSTHFTDGGRSMQVEAAARS